MRVYTLLCKCVSVKNCSPCCIAPKLVMMSLAIFLSTKDSEKHLKTYKDHICKKLPLVFSRFCGNSFENWKMLRTWKFFFYSFLTLLNTSLCGQQLQFVSKCSFIFFIATSCEMYSS